MTFEEIKEKLNNAGSYEDIENTISLIKDPKLRTQMQEFTNECEWEKQDIKLVCIVLIEKFLDPKINNNQLNELKETKTLPNISKFIYNLGQVDEDDKGIKERAWSVNAYTKDGLDNKIIIVSQNGISNLSAKDIKLSVEQAYPQLSGQITANKKGIWFYLKPIKGLKESKKKSDFDKLSDKISKEYIKKGMSKSKAEEIGNATAAKIARSKKTESEESNKEFTLEDVDKVAEELNLTFDKFTKEELLTGMNIELEHGTKFPETNVTDDDLIMTAKIALAHLNEYSNYYDEDVGLHNFERELEAALSNKEDKVEESKKITESNESTNLNQVFIDSMDEKQYFHLCDYKTDGTLKGNLNTDLWPDKAPIAKMFNRQSNIIKIRVPDVINIVYEDPDYENNRPAMGYYFDDLNEGWIMFPIKKNNLINDLNESKKLKESDEENDKYDTMAFAQWLPMSFTDYVDSHIKDDYEEMGSNYNKIENFIEDYVLQYQEDYLDAEEQEEFEYDLAKDYVRYKLDNIEKKEEKDENDKYPMIAKKDIRFAEDLTESKDDLEESDNNRKIKIGSKVYWIGAGNEISAEGEVIDFPVDSRMTIKWDDNEQNTYDITHPNIILADNYDDSVNESEKITESNEEEKNPYENIKVYMNTWGNYNEYGADAESIKGGWMTPDEALEWLDKQEIQEEEPFINDVDGKLPFEVDEYSNPKQVLEQIKDLQSLSEDEAKALSAIMESQNDNYEMCKEILDSGDYIFFPDVSDDYELGHAYVDMVGGVKGISNPEKYINQNEIEEEIRNSLEDSETEYSDEMIDELAEEEIENNKNNEKYLDDHFDYEALGRDLDMDGYYFADTGAIYVM